MVDSLDLPEDVALRLMELGFIPGTTVVAGRAAPGATPGSSGWTGVRSPSAGKPPSFSACGSRNERLLFQRVWCSQTRGREVGQRRSEAPSLPW